ncbi:hypothetical protein O9993_00795 [Vibrio lentus]|nr:hypothetical protein [Vibrio lentus]
MTQQLLLDFQTGTDTGPATDVDKACHRFLIFCRHAHSLENDTALDKVDGAGDNTYEFGASAGDASDGLLLNSKVQQAALLTVSLTSKRKTRNDEGRCWGVNGYIGSEQEVFRSTYTQVTKTGLRS